MSIVKVYVIELVESGLGLIRGLEANKSISLFFSVDREHLDAFNFSVVSCKEFSHLVFSHSWVKVLNIQVASFL